MIPARFFIQNSLPKLDSISGLVKVASSAGSCRRCTWRAIPPAPPMVAVASAPAPGQPKPQFLLKIEFPAVATLTEAQKSWGDLA